MKKNNYESSAFCFAVGMVGLFLLVIFLLLANSCSAHQTGYLITVKNGKTTEVLRTTNPAQADSLINLHICKEIGAKCNLIAVETALKHTNFFEIRTDGLTIYCEKKEVRKTRNGKLKLKKLKL